VQLLHKFYGGGGVGEGDIWDTPVNGRYGCHAATVTENH